MPHAPSLATATPRPPRLAVAALACAVLALPSAWAGARLFVWREDLLGWHGIVAGGLTMAVVLAVGALLAGLALRRGERPRLLVLAGLAANVAGLAVIAVAIVRAGGW